LLFSNSSVYSTFFLQAYITLVSIIDILIYQSMNLYVSNLSFQTTDEDLRKLFMQHGTVSSAKVITDRETGRSRGFGFVEMESTKEANEAIKGLNNKDIEGRQISVTVARERENKGSNNFGSRKKW
jgi:RNA recognition motif-containing protein